MERFWERCRSAGNIRVDRGHPHLPLLGEASALITDASSLILEYGVTGRPLCYLHNPYGPGLDQDGKFVREACTTAETGDEVAHFSDAVAAGPDPRSEARRTAHAGYVRLPEGGAGTAIKLAVESGLLAEESVGASFAA